MLTYCRRCVMPDTKPDLHLDAEGVCNACRSYESRKVVDWDQRHEELVKLLEKYRRPNGDNWDCIVPVSGGKDSTYQVVRMLQYGLNPLCVTSTTCDLSDLGRKNIENLKRLGDRDQWRSGATTGRRHSGRPGVLPVDPRFQAVADL